MQYYKIIAKSESFYYVDMYSSVYDVEPVRLKINKYKFNEWTKEKFKIENPDINIIDDEVAQNNQKISISSDEKTIMDILHKQIQKNSYILEKDVNIKNMSKAKIKETIRNDKILEKYKLKRVRATKKIKEQFGIISGGYPFIIYFLGGMEDEKGYSNF